MATLLVIVKVTVRDESPAHGPEVGDMVQSALDLGFRAGALMGWCDGVEKAEALMGFADLL